MKLYFFSWAVVAGFWLTSTLHAATGTLTVFDDADRSGFNHNAAACGGMYGFETTVVHGGSTAISILKTDSAGVGWAAPTTYSTSSDYDSVSLWVNAGDTTTNVTSLAVTDAAFNQHFLHLEDIYGSALPANTWLHFQIPFSSPFFAFNSSSPPDSLTSFCIINHTNAGSGFLYLDDVLLIGADIFKNGFDG